MRYLICVALVLALVVPFTVRPVVASPGNGLRIAGPAPGNATTPVVNEHGKQPLRVVDANGNSVSVSKWTIDNRDVARVSKKGVLKGRLYGFATVTATTDRGDVKGFVVVARVTRRQGAMTQGDTKTDTGGNVYLSSPRTHVIYQATGLSANVLAGMMGNSGFADGSGSNARFNVPTGLAVDNTATGGVYVADTMNSCIRKISPSGRVDVALGTPQMEGTMHDDSTPLSEAVMNGPRGVASVGRNYYFADTENHAIYYADYQKNEVRLVCGEPGVSGLADGHERSARFNRPSGLALSTDGRLLAVADTGNNLIRLVALPTGDVATLGVGSSARGVEMRKRWDTDDPRDAIPFVAPESVSIDTTGNVYVVDQTGASVVTRPKDVLPEKVDLAQTGTLGDPVSVTLKGTQAFVLDESATADASAISIAEVGPPQIDAVTPSTGRLEGGEEVVIDGRNFSNESKVTLGDAEVTDYTVESSRRIRVRTPAQAAPGGRTLTVLTRGGAAQRLFTIQAKAVAELAPGEITTVAGGVSFAGDGGAAILANLSIPQDVAVDGSGNLYITDRANIRIRRVGVTGVITTVAGTGVAGYDGDDMPATATRLGGQCGIAVDGAGNLFIADAYNNRIRRVDTSGRITTVAGTGQPGYDGDDKPATSTNLSVPWDVAVDNAGNLYVAELVGARIRRVDATGRITTVAGSGDFGYSGDGGPATLARLSAPRGIALDTTGNLYIADKGNERLRRVDLAGRITTVAGTGVSGYNGDDMPATSAQLGGPEAVEVDGLGNLYIADSGNGRIRRVDATGIITTVAGAGAMGYNGDDIPATSATLSIPQGVALASAGSLYIADSLNGRVRHVDASGRITTFAGTGARAYDGDDKPAISARLASPFGVAVDGSNKLFIADTYHHRIRKVDPTGRITTVAGTGEQGYNGDGRTAISASLDQPVSVAVDGAGNLYIADTGNHRIRCVDGAGRITTIAGTGVEGYDGDDKPATSARLSSPFGVAVDGSGNVYIADRGNNRIRRVDTSGRISTVAGTGERGFDGDDKPANSARLASPFGVAVDGSGNLYIGDDGNYRVRRVDATGRITTIAGTGGLGYDGDDKPAISATFNSPRSVAVDGLGNVYIGDTFNHRIRRVDTAGNVMTIVGTGEYGYDGDDNSGASASISFPNGLAVNGSGDLFLADTENSAIRVVKTAAAGP